MLIQQLNKLLAEDLHVAVLKALKKPETKVEYVVSLLSGPSRACYETLPLEIQIQLILDRDSHGVKLTSACLLLSDRLAAFCLLTEALMPLDQATSQWRRLKRRSCLAWCDCSACVNAASQRVVCCVLPSQMVGAELQARKAATLAAKAAAASSSKKSAAKAPEVEGYSGEFNFQTFYCE